MNRNLNQRSTKTEWINLRLKRLIFESDGFMDEFMKLYVKYDSQDANSEQIGNSSTDAPDKCSECNEENGWHNKRCSKFGKSTKRVMEDKHE